MTILDQTNGVLMMLKVFLMFIAVIYWIPSFVVKRSEEEEASGDLFYPTCFVGSITIIGLTHLASIGNMLDSFAVITLTILVMGTFNAFRKEKKDLSTLTFMDKVIVYILDLSDSSMNLKSKILFLMNVVLSWLQKVSAKVFQGFKKEPLLYVLNLITFGYGLAIRCFHSINHYYLPSSDAYLHLVWTKYLNENGLYRDGIYPEGMHALFAYMGTLFNVDMYYIFRFMGPVMGMMILYSLYHFVKHHLYINKYAPWMATSLYVFVSAYPSQVWRQISPLPQEFALIFMMPTIHFLMVYVEGGKKRDLILYSIGLSLAFLIHFYSGIYVILISAIYVVLRLPKIIGEKKGVPLIAWGTGAVVAGFLPMIVGFLAGFPLHVSFNFLMGSLSPSTGTKVIETAQASSQKMDFQALIQSDLGLLVTVMAAFLLILWGMGWKKQDKWALITLSVITIFAYMQYQGEFFNMPMLMLKERTGVFLSLFAAMSAGVFVGIVVQQVQNWMPTPLVEKSLSVVFLGLLLMSFKPEIPIGDQFEYDQTAKAFLTIAEQIPRNTMTLVGVQEQYQQIYGKGYHYQLWQLIENQTDDLIKDLKIPTDNVFIFTEKIPFGTEDPIQMAEARQPFPVISEDKTLYYSEYRRILEAKAYFWAEDFLKRYPKETQVYYEDSFIKIYWIKQNQLEPLDLKTGEPKEVFRR